MVERRLPSAPSSLATAPGVTSVAEGRKRITLVSAFYVSSFTAQCVLPGPASGSEWLDSVQSLSDRDPRLASSLIRRTFRTPPQPLPICAI